MTKADLLKYIDTMLTQRSDGNIGLLMVRQYVSDNVRDVIRCKDCAIRFDACPMVVRNGNYLTFFTKDDDFCSYGKGEEE